MSVELKKSNFNKALFRLGFIFILLVAVSLLTTVCSGKTDEIPDQFRVLSINSLYPRALKVAKDWKDDAYLNGVSLWVAPIDDRHPLQAFYGFESKSDPEWLIIVFNETDTGIEITETKTGSYPSGTGRPELDLSQVMFDSQEAFEKIYHKEGEEIFRRYPGMIYPIVLDITKFPDQDPKWVAIFDPDRSTTWRISMDAKTNEILEVDINE